MRFKKELIFSGLFGGLLTFIAIFSVPSITSAAGPIVRSGDSISVEANQVLEGDFYGLGGTINLSGVAEQDVVVLGGTVTINGPVASDLAVMSGVAQVHGAVGDDVRIIAGNSILAESVVGDVVVLGGTLSVLSTAKIGGDILFVGGEAQIDGDVTGSIYGASEVMRINGHVGGDVSVRALKSLSLGDSANVTGDIVYKSGPDMSRAQGATVGGTVRKENILIPSTLERAQALFFQAFVLLFAALTFFLVVREPLEHITRETFNTYGRQGLIGFAVLFAMPFVGILLTASILGSIIGIVILITYMLLLCVSWVTTSIVLGALVMKFVFKQQTALSLYSVIVGTLCMSLIPFIPFVGFLAIAALCTIVLGGVSTYVYRTFR